MLSQKMLVTKNAVVREFRLSMFRILEKVAHRSTVALGVVREMADRRCARSRDAPIDCRPNLLLRKDLSICNMLQI
jgi:hypothetical protein